MNKLLLAAGAATALLAAPAYASNDNFTGVRVGATAGADDVTGVQDTTDVVYGVDAGVDLPVGENMTFGVEAFSTNPFEDERTIGAAARVGYALNEDYLVFARAGYSNYEDVLNRDLDGLTVGGGLEIALSSLTYAKAEYRYTDFSQGVGNHGALVGVGFRF